MSRAILALLLCLHLLFPVAVWAQALKTKTALDYSLGQYGFTLAIALLGGLVSWFAKVRKGELPVWGIYQLIGELATSALAGLLCFWLCEWAGAAPLLTAAMVGISGHMGNRAITVFEDWASRKFGAVDTERVAGRLVDQKPKE